MKSIKHFFVERHGLCLENYCKLNLICREGLKRSANSHFGVLHCDKIQITFYKLRLHDKCSQNKHTTFCFSAY